MCPHGGHARPRTSLSPPACDVLTASIGPSIVTAHAPTPGAPHDSTPIAIPRVRRKRQRLGPNGSIESDPAVNVRARRVRPRAGSLPIESYRLSLLAPALSRRVIVLGSIGGNRGVAAIRAPQSSHSAACGSCGIDVFGSFRKASQRHVVVDAFVLTCAYRGRFRARCRCRRSSRFPC